MNIRKSECSFFKPLAVLIAASAFSIAGFACGGSDKPVDVDTDSGVIDDAGVIEDSGVVEDSGIIEHDAGIEDQDAGGHEGKIEYTEGDFTDQRDNNKYKTISFEMTDGSKLTLMAENMRYAGTSAEQIDHRSANGDSTNDAVYGLLYDWDTAVNKVCPSGWHLPTQTEVTYFLQYVQANMTSESIFDALCAKSNAWVCYSNKATNETGFSALPAGYWSSEDPQSPYQDFGESAHFWTNTYENGKYKIADLHMNGGHTCDDDAHAFIWLSTIDPTEARSVRCVKTEE